MVTALSGVELQQEQHKQWVDWMRAGRHYIDYPFEVAFETLALCNACCDFCPYPLLPERAGRRMSDALIEKIVDDLTAIPAEVPFQANPGGISERFLDSRIFDILELINRKLPHAGLPLNSNGSTLTERNLLRLVQVKQIISLNVSLNEYRPELYEQVMGLPFSRTIAHLNVLHELKLANRAYFPVVISRVRDGTEHDDRFVKWVREHYPAFDTALLIRGDFLGAANIRVPLVAVPDIPCSQWFKLRIWADGKAALCCVDTHPGPEHGDVFTQHVLDIYNQPARRQRRLNVISRREVDACSRCNMLV